MTAATTTAANIAKTIPTLEYERVVIGSNLEAVLFAFIYELPLLYSRPERPFRFDYLPKGADLKCVGLEKMEHKAFTHADPINLGHSKAELWGRLLFLLSLKGLAPLGNLCESLRYSGDRLVCSNEYSKIAEIKFQKAYYFGDDNCTGLVIQKTVANPVYTCYDWIEFNRGGKHEIDLIQTEDDFVNEVWFYPSDRIDGATAVKDACVVSTLTEEQLLDFDYSQTMARFKMIAEMRERGMRGLFNGYSPTGTPKYYKFRTTIIGRERRKKPLRPQPSIATVEIPEVNEKDLLQSLPQACVGYHRLLDNL